MNKDHLEIDRTDFFYPSSCHYLSKKINLANKFIASTVYGVCFGVTKITYDKSDLTLQSESYFCLTLHKDIANFTIESKIGVVIFVRHGYIGLNQVGLSAESSGRLTYIDGCTTSTLISPPRYGDPSLNLLSFPAKTEQSFHRHPTLRLGVILDGNGFADVEKKSYRIAKHSIFSISENERHRFRTKDKTLRLIAFHPDSDFGPRDNDHAMLNRTYLISK